MEVSHSHPQNRVSYWHRKCCCAGWYGCIHIQGYSRWAKNILLVCTTSSAKESLQTRPKSILILGRRVSDHRKEQDNVLLQISWRASLCKDQSPLINRQYVLFPQHSLVLCRNSHTLLIPPGRRQNWPTKFLYDGHGQRPTCGLRPILSIRTDNSSLLRRALGIASAHYFIAWSLTSHS